MSKIADLAKQGVYYRPLSDSAAQPEAQKKDEQGDFSRGFKKAMLQVPQTLGGSAALVGDLVGAEGLKEYGLGVYQNNSDKIQAITKDSDSLSNVMEGDASGVDWLQNTAGYVAGQAVQAVATGGIGGFIGSQLAKRGIAEVVKRGAGSLVAREVAGKVAAQGAKYGAGAAMLGNNLAQEAGSIYPEALNHAAEQGRELSGEDKARVVGSAVVAAGVDTAMDALMMGRVLKGARKPGESMLRAGVREVPGAMAREGITEGIQTGIERYGAGQELGTADAIRDYVDSVGVGMVGGGMGGGASVIRANKTVPEVGPLSRAANIATEQEILQLENNPQPLISFPDGTVGTEAEKQAFLSQFEGEERQRKERELMGRDPETGKRVEPPQEEPAKSADTPEAEAQSLAEWGAQHEPIPLEQAHALLAAPGTKGENLMVAPHPSGEGFTLVPAEWLTLDSQARHAELQKPVKETAKGKADAVPATSDAGAVRPDAVPDAQPGAVDAARQPGADVALPAVDAAPGAPALTLPRVAVGDPNGWSNQNAQAARDLADRAGLTEKIEDAFAQGKTAALVRTELKPLMRHIPEEEQTGFIVGVRATLGIPSQMDEDGKGEFQAWKASYNARKAPAAAPADPAEPEWKTNPYTAYKFAERARADAFMANKGADPALFEVREIDGKFAIKRRPEPVLTEGAPHADDAVLPQDDGTAGGTGNRAADPAGSSEDLGNSPAAAQPGERGTADVAAGEPVQPDHVRATGSADTDAALGAPVEIDAYHGTGVDFAEFSDAGLGSHFTTDQKVASDFAASFKEGGNVRKVKLKIRNPLRTKDHGGSHTDATSVAQSLVEEGHLPADYVNDDFYARLVNGPNGEHLSGQAYHEANLRELERIKAILQAKGYDSIVYENTVEGGGDTYIAFDKAQAKPAVAANPTKLAAARAKHARQDEEVRKAAENIERRRAEREATAKPKEETADVPERPQVPEEAPPAAGKEAAPESRNDAAPADGQRDDGADIPLAFFAKVKVPHDVFVEETGATQTIELPADQALKSVREDIASLQALLKCMKGGK